MRVGDTDDLARGRQARIFTDDIVNKKKMFLPKAICVNLPHQRHPTD
jgi:hypothetical protein